MLKQLIFFSHFYSLDTESNKSKPIYILDIVVTEIYVNYLQNKIPSFNNICYII